MTKPHLILYALPLLICLWAAGPAIARAETTADKTDEPLAPPPFSLRNLPDDSPELLKKKAALRLLRGYMQTEKGLVSCKNSQPDAGRALGAYGQRNGNSLALVMKTIKQSGGLNPEIREALEEAINSLPTPDCSSLINEVNSGRHDIYKAPQYLDDYKLIQAK